MNPFEKFSSMFSETDANYAAFGQMKIKMLKLNIKIIKQQHKFKNRQRSNAKYTDLILKMIKKAKIYHVTVPLSDFQYRFDRLFLHT